VPRTTLTKVISVLAVLFIVLLLVCLLAPFLGRDTSDAHGEQSRPVAGWFPPLSR
jgi:preprotein translocase subunit SecG